MSYFVLHIPLDRTKKYAKVKDKANLYQIPESANKAFNHNKLWYKIGEIKLSDENIKEAISILTAQDSFAEDDIFIFNS